MKRMPHQYGSITKLKGIRSKPWRALAPQVTVFIPDPDDMTKSKKKSVRKCIGCFRTRSEALDALLKYKMDNLSGKDKTPTVLQIWGEIRAKIYSGLSESRAKSYDKAFERLETIHNAKINELKLADLQPLVTGLTYNPALSVKIVLNRIFEYAIMYDHAEKNYAKFIDCGKNETKDIHHRLSEEELNMLWLHKDDNDFIKIMLILCYSGMRIGEALTLKTENIHLDERFMRGGMKTEAGRNRIIPIHKRILPIIEEFKNRGNSVLYKWEKTEPALIINITRAMDFVGVTDHKSHDGRKTFASRMRSAGVDKTTVQKIVGHKSGDLLSDTYTEKTIEELINAVDKLT